MVKPKVSNCCIVLLYMKLIAVFVLHGLAKKMARNRKRTSIQHSWGALAIKTSYFGKMSYTRACAGFLKSLYIVQLPAVENTFTEEQE